MPKRQLGSVSLSFLALLIPILLMLVATLMIGFQVILSGRAGQAVDSAAIACAFSDRSNPVLNHAYLDYYQPNIKQVTTQADASSGCEIKMGYQLTGLFPSLTFARASYHTQGQSTEHAHVSQSASVVPTEMTLVLDISSSMFDSVDQLKAILLRAIDRIEQDNVLIDGQRAISIAVVPFSDGVSVKNAPWLDEKGIFCVDGLAKESGGTFNVDDTVRNLDLTHGQHPVKHRAPEQYLGDCSESASILPLTRDMNQVKEAIRQLSTTGGTASYQGVIWGARQLIPSWRREWLYHSYSVTPAQKLILMTDGVDSGSVFDDLVSAGLCDRLANEFGIQLNFIGFSVPSRRLDQFSDCVNSARAGEARGQVFSATNTQELDDYFSKVLEVQYDNRLNFGTN
ncbi:hypothetical protein ACFFUP_14045 [Vibrio ostreicida]|uniref:VWFA domain-containing protein n=1 Tax=Vibrio ostreicida TaxID=526588 RepID=A0ABT8BZ26_9VIBR|nr:hypothetical protein [Vibrio ostreicida]MDN3612288.1 hypothetical protein [Vibrio ostreicida]NPD08671.1 hypothetical protein [Vibrio ostreicida]